MDTIQDILRLTKVNKGFPGVKALTDMNFSLKKGEVHALVGENGAGKSTLMKVISGAYKKDSGTIEFEGKKVEITSPKHAETLGIAIIYQELNLINRMTVAENIFLGRYPKKNGVVQWKRMYSDAQELFDSFDIQMNVREMLRGLSLAKQQITEIIKAVSIKAKVVIMDEPTSSLTSHETDILFKIIKVLKSHDISVVFITHRLDEIFAICDRMTVLRDGCYIGVREVKDIDKRELISMMIGRELTQQYPSRDVKFGDVVFEIKDLSDHANRVKDVSFNVRAGEVLGFAGLVGAGRTETMRLIFGVDKKMTGKLYIEGKEVRIRNPRDAIYNKIGFVTENRKKEGLFLRSTIRVNTVMVALEKILRCGFCFNFSKEKKYTEDYIKILNIITPSSKKEVMLLSGGNQQKVVLAKWLMSNSRIVIFDEPTRGIDVGAKREIYEIINGLVSKGKVVIVVSSEMEEIMGISDRIIVMHEGKISGEVLKKDFSQSLITEYAVGVK